MTIDVPVIRGEETVRERVVVVNNDDRALIVVRNARGVESKVGRASGVRVVRVRISSRGVES